MIRLNHEFSEMNQGPILNEITLYHCSSFFLINLLVVLGWPFGDNVCSAVLVDVHYLPGTVPSVMDTGNNKTVFMSLPFFSWILGSGAVEEGRRNIFLKAHESEV